MKGSTVPRSALCRQTDLCDGQHIANHPLLQYLLVVCRTIEKKFRMQSIQIETTNSVFAPRSLANIIQLHNLLQCCISAIEQSTSRERLELSDMSCAFQWIRNINQLLFLSSRRSEGIGGRTLIESSREWNTTEW